MHERREEKKIRRREKACIAGIRLRKDMIKAVLEEDA